LRAEAIGISRRLVQWRAFVLASFTAGAAGSLFAFFKGSVFPDALSISTSVDGLVMVLLGGVGTTVGPIVGALAFKLLSFWLISHTDYSKLALGAIIIGIVLLLPRGIAGAMPSALWFARSRGAKP
jgi:branched-chain amino acid transport system permease protein